MSQTYVKKAAPLVATWALLGPFAQVHGELTSQTMLFTEPSMSFHKKLDGCAQVSRVAAAREPAP